MAMKQPGRKVYRTANGKHIDLDLLISRNELTPAVGNARVNARGDELGPGGKIIKKREDVLKEYYAQTGSVKDETVNKQQDKDEDNVVNAAEIAEWEEDDEGNFIIKRK